MLLVVKQLPSAAAVHLLLGVLVIALNLAGFSAVKLSQAVFGNDDNDKNCTPAWLVGASAETFALAMISCGGIVYSRL